MTIYLDASIVVSLFVVDANCLRAETFLRRAHPLLTLSDFAAAEFASALGKLRRTGTLTTRDVRSALENFDLWRATGAIAVDTIPADVAAADAMLRRSDLTLRTPDALNLAIARRVGAEVATFDAGMAANATKLGIRLAPL